MARRFNDTGRWKALRKLEASLKNLYNYCWDMCDASGVYDLDWDYLKADIGRQYKDSDFDILEKEISTFKKIGPGKFLFTDFIFINYGKLREGYNPHKPVFRDIEKNKLEINSSLNQACFKLEEEDEYKDEDEDEEDKGGVGENKKPIQKPDKTEIVLPFISEKFKVAWNNWIKYRKEIGKPYKSPQSEQLALKKLSEFDEQFAIDLIERSISNSYQGLIFDSTKTDYLNGKKNGTNNNSKNLNSTINIGSGNKMGKL